jgi:urease accessory protein
LHILATLEPIIVEAAARALARSIDDLGSATVMVDWASSVHETQYSRLFRS